MTLDEIMRQQREATIGPALADVYDALEDVYDALEEIENERNALLVALYDVFEEVVEWGSVMEEKIMSVFIAVTGDSYHPTIAEKQAAAEFVRRRLESKR